MERPRRGALSRGMATVSAAASGSFDLCADGGIGGLQPGLRAGGRAAEDANEREQGEETAKRPPAIGHRSSATPRVDARRLCNHLGEDQATVIPFADKRR